MLSGYPDSLVGIGVDARGPIIWEFLVVALYTDPARANCHTISTSCSFTVFSEQLLLYTNNNI